jgi:hypothetical protein
MKDQRVPVLRRTLQALLESLDATARLSRWSSADSAPEPLQESAAKLEERLSAANGLSSCRFVGPSQVVATLTTMSEAVKHLDEAYVLYQSRIHSKPAEQADAAVALDAEIGSVRSYIESLAR